MRGEHTYSAKGPFVFGNPPRVAVGHSLARLWHDLARDMARLEGAKSIGKIDLVTMSRLQPPGDARPPSSTLHRPGAFDISERPGRLSSRLIQVSPRRLFPYWTLDTAYAESMSGRSTHESVACGLFPLPTQWGEGQGEGRLLLTGCGLSLIKVRPSTFKVIQGCQGSESRSFKVIQG
jgi:hypothetical protein